MYNIVLCFLFVVLYTKEVLLPDRKPYLLRYLRRFINEFLTWKRFWECKKWNDDTESQESSKNEAHPPSSNKEWALRIQAKAVKEKKC